MKKTVLLLTVALFLLTFTPISLASSVNLASLSYDELLTLQIAVGKEVVSRPEHKSVNVPLGVYEVGVHIPAGEYTVTTSSFCSVTVHTSSDTSSYSNIDSINSVDSDSSIGRLILKDGMFVVIEYGTATFSKFIGLGF